MVVGTILTVTALGAWVVVAVTVWDDARLRGFDRPWLCALIVFVFGAVFFLGLLWYLWKIKPAPDDDEREEHSGYRTDDHTDVTLPSADSNR